MTLHRTILAGTAAVTAVLALVAVPAGRAAAHGATTDPVSRAAACGPEGGARQASAACRAAVRANGGQDLADWDNLRLPDVAGRDRDRIPDGRLCSAGLPAYRGLDLPRADWPSTRLTAGAAYTFTYRGTIPHKGTFRLYVTNDGYDPERPLRWSDLDRKPFLEVVDPPLRQGSYRLTGRLPAERSGRQLIYAIWQNSDTPDTYYSCSDVEFSGGAAARGRAGSDRSPGSGTPGRAGAAQSPAAGAPGRAGAAEPARDLQPVSEQQQPPPGPARSGTAGTAPAQDGPGPLVVAGLAAALAVVTAMAALRRYRRQRQRS